MNNEELNVSLKTKMFLEKIGIKTIKDAYNYDLKKLLWLKKGNHTVGKYLDELWEYMQILGLGFRDEENYYYDLKAYYRNLENLSVDDFFFLPSKVHTYLNSYGTIKNFLLAIKDDPHQLKRFLYFNVDLDNISLLNKTFSCLGVDGAVLKIILAKYAKDLDTIGPFTPIYKIFQDKMVINCFIRQNIWMLNDLVNLPNKKLEKIAGLGEVKRCLAISDLERQGISLEEYQYQEDLKLSLDFIKIKDLNLPKKLQVKLEDLGIITLKNLVQLRYLNFLDKDEILIIRATLKALEIQDNNNILTMDLDTIKNTYLKKTVQLYGQKEQIKRLEMENYGYVMILKLEKGKSNE